MVDVGSKVLIGSCVTNTAAAEAAFASLIVTGGCGSLAGEDFAHAS
jgi:hypothetical protein